MKTNIIRWTLTTAFAVSATFGAVAMNAGEAHAETVDAHPDFVWLPTSVESNRLFVGGLSWGSSADASVYFNPKEIAVAKQVPW